MAKQIADETVTIRLPRGMADQIRAASGQPLSRLCRWMLSEYLRKEQARASDALNAAHRAAVEASNTVGDKL